MLDENGLTPTEARMFALLSDGLPHSHQELRGCLWDELAERNAVSVHLAHLRRKIRSRGQMVVCKVKQSQSYTLIKPSEIIS